MGRREIRNQREFLKKKLTPEQFEVLKSETMDEAVKRKVQAIWRAAEGGFRGVLRANKISEERTEKILGEMEIMLQAARGELNA